MHSIYVSYKINQAITLVRPLPIYVSVGELNRSRVVGLNSRQLWKKINLISPDIELRMSQTLRCILSCGGGYYHFPRTKTAGNSQVTRIENPGGALAVGLQVLTRFDFNLLQLRPLAGAPPIAPERKEQSLFSAK